MLKWLRYIVAAVLIGVILSIVDIGEVGAALRSISWPYILAAIGVFAINRLMMGYKWSLLLRTLGYPILTLLATKIYIIGATLGLILPSTIGLDAARAHLVRERQVALVDVLASIFVERLLGIMALAVACMVSLMILVTKAIDVPAGGLAVAIVATLMTASLCLALALKTRSPVEALIPAAVAARLAGILTQATAAFATYRGRLGTLATVFVWSLIEQIPHIVGTYLLAVGLELPIGLIDCVAVVPIVMIIDRLPISVDGLGVREGAMVFFFGLLGVSAEQALVLSLVTRVVGYVFIALGWGLYVLDNPSKQRA